MKKKDFVVILIFLAVAVILWILMNKIPGDTAGGEVVIYKNREEFAVIPLTDERTIVVEDKGGNRNVIRIEDGKVRMIEANCPDQVCVNTRPAQADGQSIICLPNRVAVEVRSTGKNEIDGVSE